MRIEAGKYYKTRDGQKAGPAVRCSETVIQSWKLMVNTYPRYYNSDGSWMSPEQDEPLDLVALWQDPASQGPVRTKTVKEITPGKWKIWPDYNRR